jgi:hypothetical protein
MSREVTMGIKEALAERHQELVESLPERTKPDIICENKDGWGMPLSEEERAEADDVVREYALAKEAESEAKRRIDKAKKRLLAFAGRLQAEAIETPAAYVTVKEQPGRRSWDSKLLQELFQGDDEALKRYYRPGNPWTKISIKPKLQ